MASYAKPFTVTFTGVDQATDLVELQALANRYPQAEFAILYKPGGSEKNRYPKPSFIESFALLDVRKALHLCGAASDRIMRKEVPCLPVSTARFGRVQVNHREPEAKAIWDYVAGFRGIAQCRGDAFPDVSTVMWLFDRSGGRGELPERWPPHPGRYCGYAGGITPDNVIETLERIGAKGKYWIDMETGVRTDDWFDLVKCERVLRAVYGSRT